MPLGDVGHSRGERFCSSDEVRALIARRYALIDCDERSGGPARYLRLPDHPGTRVGFISPHSENFCASCNRLRITADGRLLLCLGHAEALDLRELMRNEADDRALHAAIDGAVLEKAAGHDFSLAGDVQVARFMNASGG